MEGPLDTFLGKSLNDFDGIFLFPDTNFLRGQLTLHHRAVSVKKGVPVSQDGQHGDIGQAYH
jgi:hypothetical protein